MKNTTIFKKAVIFSAFFFAFFEGFAQGGSQSPVAGIGYAPGNDYVILSQLYKGRNGVAIWTNKNDVFSTSENLNIFFISESGNNSTAEIGNPFKQYDNLIPAKDTAVSNGIDSAFFYIQKSNLTYSGPYSTTFPNVSRINPPGYSNFYLQDGTNLYFSGNTNIWQYFTDIDNNVLVASYNPSTFNLNAPNASIYENSSTNSYPLSFYNAQSSVKVRLQKLSLGTSASTAKGAIFSSGYADVEIDTIHSTGMVGIGIAVGRDSSGEASGAHKRNISIKVKDYKTTGGSPNNGLNCSIRYQPDGTGTFVDSLSTIKMDFEKVDIASDGIMYAIRGDTAKFLDIETNIQKAEIAGNVIYIYARDGGGNGVYQNSSLRLNMGDVNAGSPIVLGRGRLILDSSEIVINTEQGFYDDSETIPYQASGSTFQMYNHSALRFNYDNCSLIQPYKFISFLSDSTNRIEFKGNYTVRTAGKSVLEFQSMNDSVFIQGAFYNDGVTPAISSTTPLTVYLTGEVYFNSPNFDPDVTFVKLDYGYLDPTTSNYDDTQTILNNIASLVSAGNNIYNTDDALTANRTVTGANFNLQFSNVAAFRANGAGTANWRIDFFPNSSLPSILEQIVGTDTANVEFIASLGRSILKGTQEVFIESPYLAVGTTGDYVDYPATQATSPSFWRYNTDGTGQYKATQNGVAFDTTDGSGDITISFAENMPDATFTALCIPDSVTGQYANVQSKTNSSVTVRIFDSGGAVASTGVIVNWSVTDY